MDENLEKVKLLAADLRDGKEFPRSLPLELQEYMEDYIQQFNPRNRVVHHWFDVCDLEEERI